MRKINAAERKALLYEQYWVPSGAGKCNVKLAIVVFDTALNMGVGRAKEFLTASGGDLTKFMALRKQKYLSLAAKPKYKDQKQGWLNRQTDLGKTLQAMNTNNIA